MDLESPGLADLREIMSIDGIGRLVDFMLQLWRARLKQSDDRLERGTVLLQAGQLGHGDDRIFRKSDGMHQRMLDAPDGIQIRPIPGPTNQHAFPSE